MNAEFLPEISLYDGNYKCLTNPEAYALAHAASLDTARNCILEARRIGGCPGISDDERAINRNEKESIIYHYPFR
jgi:hypothetical protein